MALACLHIEYAHQQIMDEGRPLAPLWILSISRLWMKGDREGRPYKDDEALQEFPYLCTGDPRGRPSEGSLEGSFEPKFHLHYTRPTAITSPKSLPRSFSSTMAALRPGAPVTEPPGCVV